MVSAVQIEEPVPEESIDDPAVGLKQFKTGHGRRLSGRPQPPQSINSSKSSVYEGSPSLRAAAAHVRRARPAATDPCRGRVDATPRAMTVREPSLPGSSCSAGERRGGRGTRLFLCGRLLRAHANSSPPGSDRRLSVPLLCARPWSLNFRRE